MNVDARGPGACAPHPPAMGRLVVAVALLDVEPHPAAPHPVGVGSGPGPRVLAARRQEPSAYAGMWEFPGGKVEPGESEHEALARECREELDVGIEIGPSLGEVGLASPGWVLRVWFGRITQGQPRLVAHDALRWLSAAELDDVPWMPADGPLVERLREVLTTPGLLPTWPPAR
ncbi:(deoxy)nucleoside triphosphate pyrophosphohydrolase [Frankia sp. R82]|uniref:(deoxy)nucleoside triphosphate pyrophosphohydrolase n=1 Tax=Frankia sp. R82 TaxID=2950553 RepID=UPI0020438437|nr:(deoxy)nucleoside triphosphate pyrophosphohydrolase [Frankia sp. R82]MCM3883448.1 (deoxy)nucleoside triphosphate pyrophosphohydrolase [Frankia sp. R82]